MESENQPSARNYSEIKSSPAKPQRRSQEIVSTNSTASEACDVNFISESSVSKNISINCDVSKVDTQHIHENNSKDDNCGNKSARREAKSLTSPLSDKRRAWYDVGSFMLMDQEQNILDTMSKVEFEQMHFVFNDVRENHSASDEKPHSPLFETSSDGSCSGFSPARTNATSSSTLDNEEAPQSISPGTSSEEVLSNGMSLTTSIEEGKSENSLSIENESQIFPVDNISHILVCEESATQRLSVDKSSINTTGELNNADENLDEESKIFLPSAIAVVKQTYAEMNYNRYSYRLRYSNPFQSPVSPALDLSSKKTDTFGTLHRKFRKSIRKNSKTKPEVPEVFLVSMKLFLKKEEIHAKELEALITHTESYGDPVTDECLLMLKTMKASCDAIIEHASKRTLSIGLFVEIFFKEIERLKVHANVLKVARQIEVAAYDKDKRYLLSLLEKLLVLNQKLPYYCQTLHSWLELRPYEDNSGLGDLIDVLEQIRFDSLLPI
ncbi:uncharacterized protein LOC108679104 isoform X1 [Hyalella azteca]|uniref:Uncharacterized protein LOC108679104 isoform X1 n=1 Tax=Hyalella azteca TaxID=294128 RepID=A0A8B7PAK7_HYAAZ|nr:uncharacterized protein LOC108679104 isoform X1 [Hyalella azteca]XP_018023196.1 uncharacterized protein LOC108679104 isoform X1 [Hyalella azteca]XP_047740484.1 uncharacterized protein LOC108679104 isoform X1 [Hyalella azteca]XP_047740485.1 uncharacterized protein LOC108679104 isoform X1 [Hyalella azteca]